MDIDKFTKAIKQVTKWDDTNSVFGFVDFGLFKTNYIFEFYSAMRILNDLSNKHRLRVVPNIDEKVIFPRSHANKDGYSHIRVFLSDDTYDFVEVWLGVNIGHSMYPGYTHAPDISFQVNNSPQFPNEDHLLMMIDIKYYKDGLQIEIIDSFIAKVKRFGFPKFDPSYNRLEFSEFNFLSYPAIITNSNVHGNSEMICRNEGVIQLGQFMPDEAFRKIGAV